MSTGEERNPPVGGSQPDRQTGLHASGNCCPNSQVRQYDSGAVLGSANFDSTQNPRFAKKIGRTASIDAVVWRGGTPLPDWRLDTSGPGLSGPFHVRPTSVLTEQTPSVAGGSAPHSEPTASRRLQRPAFLRHRSSGIGSRKGASGMAEAETAGAGYSAWRCTRTANGGSVIGQVTAVENNASHQCHFARGSGSVASNSETTTRYNPTATATRRQGRAWHVTVPQIPSRLSPTVIITMSDDNNSCHRCCGI